MNCKSKFVLALLAILALLLTAATATLAGLALAPNTLLSTIVPPTVAYVSIGVAVFLFLVALTAAAAACGKKPRCSLTLLSVVLTLLFVATTGGTVAAFGYQDILDKARAGGFSGAAGAVDEGVTGARKLVYDALRGVVTSGYDGCKPVSYNTNAVKAECALFSLTGFQMCSSDDYPSDRAGLFCTQGPDLEPFTVDRAVNYPAPGAAWPLTTPWNFGSVMNYACMPSGGSYNSAFASAELIRLGGAPAADDLFGQCYASPWWTGDGFSSNNYGSTVNDHELTASETLFFASLTPFRQSISPKMVFCFCATDPDSKFYNYLRWSAEWSRWVLLGFSIFFFFCLISCLVLLCSKKRRPAGGASKQNFMRP